METLLSEATKLANDNDTVSESKARELLESPCLQKLRRGPCGPEFSEAFLCYLKSSKEEKGSDCVHQFEGLKKCIETNPDAFKTEDVLERSKDKTDEEKPTPSYVFPSWFKVSDKKRRKRKKDDDDDVTK